MRKSNGNKTRETFTTLEYRARMEQERKELLKDNQQPNPPVWNISHEVNYGSPREGQKNTMRKYCVWRNPFTECRCLWADIYIDPRFLSEKGQFGRGDGALFRERK